MFSTLFWPSLSASQWNSRSAGAGGKYADHRLTSSGPIRWWALLGVHRGVVHGLHPLQRIVEFDRHHHHDAAETVAGDPVR